MIYMIPKDKTLRKWYFIVSAIGLLLLVVVGWSINAFLYDTLTITIGEREIEPGRTHLSELLADGYLISSDRDSEFSNEKHRNVYNVFYDPATVIDGNTTLWGTVLVKGDEKYAYVNLITGDGKKKIENCVIQDIILYEPLLNAEACAIDGIPVKDATVERITEKRGEYKEQSGPNSDGIVTTEWTKGGYQLTLDMDSTSKVTQIVAKDKRVIKW